MLFKHLAIYAQRYTRYTLLTPVFLVTLCYAARSMNDLADEVEKSTVQILVYNEEGKRTGKGSGFFIHSDGCVATCLHVLEGAHYAEIVTYDNRIFDIKRVHAEDIKTDLVIVSVDIKENAYTPLAISTSEPKPGDSIAVVAYIIATGINKFCGIVERVQVTLVKGPMLQISTPVYKGSSGAPVVNNEDEVIGVVTMGGKCEGETAHFAVSVASLLGMELKDSVEFLAWDGCGVNEDYQISRYAFIYGCNTMVSGYYAKAATYFQRAIRFDADRPEYHTELGLCYEQLGEYEKAIESFKRAIVLDTTFARAYYGMGTTYFAAKRFTDAINAFQMVNKLQPAYAKAYHGKGLVYAEQGNLDMAIGEYRIALEHDANNSATYYALGVAYSDMGEYKKAVGAFKNVVMLKPDCAQAYYNLGVNYGDLRDYLREIESYEKVIELKPDYCDAIYNLALTYFIIGEDEKAYKQQSVLKKLDADRAKKLLKIFKQYQ